MMRTDKVAKVKELEEILKEAKSAYLADFQGMSVEVISELRKRCRQSDIRFEVVKNTLLRRAAKATGNDGLLPQMSGPTALATSMVDEVAPAKVLLDFQREFKRPEVKAGIIDGKGLDAAEVKAVSELPSKDVLIGQFMRTMQMPLTNFVSAITSPLRDLVGVLNALAEKKA